MGWFAEQIRERIRKDEEDFSDAMEEISSIITGRQSNSDTVHRKEERSMYQTLLLFSS